MKVGRVADNIWKRSIRKKLSAHMVADGKKGAGAGRDVSEFESGIILGESCITPFCKQMGMLAVIRAVNAISVYCKKTEGVMLSLMLDGRSSEEFASHVAKEAGETALKLNTVVAGFDAHIIQGLKKPYIISYGVGQKESSDTKELNTENSNIENSNTGNSDTPKCMKYIPDEDIVISGFIGLSGTSIIAENNREQLISHFPEAYIDSAINFGTMCYVNDHMDVLRENENVHYIRQVSEAGIMSALWDLTEGGKKGLQVYLRKIPVKQETIEVCNFLDVNPYELLSDGCVVFTTSDSEGVIAQLDKLGIPAVVVGRTVKNNDKLIINEDENRYLTVPAQDSIYQLV